MDFGVLPPEINSGRMYAGPGSGPMMAAAAAWDSLAAELGLAAGGYRLAISELTGAYWAGPAAASMVAAVTPYVASAPPPVRLNRRACRPERPRQPMSWRLR